MNVRDTSLLELITNKAKRNNMTMTVLAKQCHISRATLYRYIQQTTPPPKSFFDKLITILQLSEVEASMLQQYYLAGGTSPYEIAFPALQHLLLERNSIIPFVIPNTEVLVFTAQDKTISSFSDIVQQINSILEQESDYSVDMHIVGFTAPTYFILLQHVVSQLSHKTNHFTVEHLVSLPEDKPDEVIALISNLFFLFPYNNYNVCYRECPSTGPDDGIWSNTMLLKVQSNFDETKSMYFQFSLYGNNQVQCFHFNNNMSYFYLLNTYSHIRLQYTKSLVNYRNLVALNQKMIEFESDGVQAIFKPDLRQNYIPPEAFRSMIKRINATSRHSLANSLFSMHVEASLVDAHLQQALTLLEHRYEDTFRSTHYVVCNIDGLRYLARAGTFMDKAISLPPFSKEERILIFESLYKRVTNPDDSLKLVLLKPKILPRGEIMIVNQEKGALIAFGYENVYRSCRNILLNTPLVTEPFIDYAKHLYAKQQSETPMLCKNVLIDILQGLRMDRRKKPSF